MQANEHEYLAWNRRLHLNFWWGQRFPVVGLELVEFVKLQADVLDGQLEHVPEAGQVLGDGPRVRVWVLTRQKHTRVTIAKPPCVI